MGKGLPRSLARAGISGGSGTPAGAGVSASDGRALGGNVQVAQLQLRDTPVVMADQAGVVAFGSLKIFDMPAGLVQIMGVVADLALTKSSAGVIATWDGDASIGSAPAAGDATLTGTEANIVPSTPTPQAVAGATTADMKSTAGVMLDGTATPVDLYLNLLVDDADHDVTTTPCNLIVNGQITVTFVALGDI